MVRLGHFIDTACCELPVELENYQFRLVWQTLYRYEYYDDKCGRIE